MKKIKCILLVDDDATTNFLNEELINDLGIAEEVHVALNGQEALNYLHKKGKFKATREGEYPTPSLIFLDINMPLMGGFEFLEKYHQLPAIKKAEVVIVFLTTSDSHKDKIKQLNDEVVRDFIEKPLKKQELLKIMEEHFGETV